MKQPKTVLLTALFLTMPGFAIAQGAADRGAAEPGATQTETRYGGERFLTKASATQMRSDKLIGADVKDSAGEDVGRVDELLLERDGEIAGLVIDIGGLLGVGAHTVAVAWSDVDVQRDDDDYVVRIGLTQDELEEAPEFDDGDDFMGSL